MLTALRWCEESTCSGCAYEPEKERKGCRINRDVIKLLEEYKLMRLNDYDRGLGSQKELEKRFREWAARNKAEVCCTCGRGTYALKDHTRCPIEKEYALVLDGHCHLWEAKKDV